MKKLMRWFDKWLPVVWGMLWLFIITAASVGATIWIVKWIASLLGVM